jgi:hypothetical protein
LVTTYLLVMRGGYYGYLRVILHFTVNRGVADDQLTADDDGIGGAGGGGAAELFEEAAAGKGTKYFQRACKGLKRLSKGD